MFGISSINVNGLNDPNKRNTIFSHFKNSEDDIFFLQDLTADSKNKLDKWLQKWEGGSYWAGKDKSSSIAILFMKNTQFEVDKISEDENGRFLLVNGTKDDKNVTLCNIYAPSGPQKSPRITSVQYSGGCSVLRRLFSNVGDSISTVEAVQYCRGIASVLRVDSISTAEE